MTQPAPVTCVVTSYNNKDTLQAAVMSVINQSRPVSEIIIADDGSTDGSHQLIFELASKYSTVMPLIQPKNLGVAANRDLGIRASKYPFVTHLDGDDLFATKKISAEWEVLRGDEDVVAYSYIARVSVHQAWRSAVLDPSPIIKDDKHATLVNILLRSGPIPRDMLLSKKLYEEAGGFTHGLLMYEDWQFKLRLAAKANQWRLSSEIGTIYIQRDGSLSSADQMKHEYWKRYVADQVAPLIVEKLGRKYAAECLVRFFGKEAIIHEMPVSKKLIGELVSEVTIPDSKNKNGLISRLRVVDRCRYLKFFRVINAAMKNNCQPNGYFPISNY